MLIPVFLGVVSLHAQFGGTGALPDESRSPMAIRSPQKMLCKLDVSGDIWVGKRSIRGGSIRVRDLSGTGILSASGVIRFFFANGRFHDQLWRADSYGTSFSSSKVRPVDEVFSSGLEFPTRAEGQVLGVLFADGDTCGETGENLKVRHTRFLDSLRQDADEAVALAERLSPAQFEKSVRDGLLPVGPYSRETTANSNATIRGQLIATNGGLVLEYKQWLKQWRDSIKPARSAHQKLSSRRPAL